jgi:hypothetical protein
MQDARRGGLRAVRLAVAFVVSLSATAFAQVDTGSIAGTVTDQTGAALPGVTITVTGTTTGQVRTAVTNEQGRYQVSALQPSRYSVKAELQGFATVLRPEVTVNVGSALDINIPMAVASLAETVTVTGEAPLIESTKTDLSNVVSQEYLESLPSRSRQFLDFTLLMPATSENTSTSAQGTGLNIGGARAKESSLLVDGFYNLDEGFAKVKQRYSEDSIQEFQIISFGGSAEYGRAIGGIVNAVTKSGSNDYRGSVYAYKRDEKLNALDFGSKALGLTQKPDFSRQQWGGTLGGPIVRDKSFVFGAYERVKEDTPFNNSVTLQNAAAVGLAPSDAGNIPQYYRLNFAMGKWDHNLSSNNRLQGSFAMSRWTEYNQSPAAFRTRSATYGLSAVDLSFLGKWTGIGGGGKSLHEIKVSYFPRYYSVEGQPTGGPPLVPEGQINLGPEGNAAPPRVTISNVATFGSAALNNSIDTYPAQVLYTSTRFAGTHTVKFGADYMAAYYDYTLYSPLTGSYSFSSLANFQRGAYTQYSQSFGDLHNPRWHQYISGFAQDSWQPSNRLTLNYGVRYDVEVHPKQRQLNQRFGWDRNNIGPRFAASYDLTGSGTTFLKFASGIYYDRIFQNETTFYTNVKGFQTSQSATWTPTTPGAPVYPNVFATRPDNLPSGVVNTNIMPDALRTPWSAQVVGTLERALTTNTAVTARMVYTRSFDREYQWDTNLVWDEAAQRWIRPEAAYRQILQYRFNGKAEYLGGIFEINRRSARIGFNGNLTIARAYESSNNYSSQPNDQRFGIEGDWGPQTDTPTVRGVLSGWYNISPMIQVSSSFRARTGIAVNPIASGVDLNGDGNLNDRTPTFGRNSFRGPSNNQLDARFTWAIPVQSSRKLLLYVEAFNLLNQENVLTVNGNYGPNPSAPLGSWMAPQGWAPPREVQLAARFTF